MSDESGATSLTTCSPCGPMSPRAKNDSTRSYSCASTTSTTRCTPPQGTLQFSTLTPKILTKKPHTIRAFTGRIHPIHAILKPSCKISNRRLPKDNSNSSPVQMRQRTTSRLRWFSRITVGTSPRSQAFITNLRQLLLPLNLNQRIAM